MPMMPGKPPKIAPPIATFERRFRFFGSFRALTLGLLTSFGFRGFFASFRQSARTVIFRTLAFTPMCAQTENEQREQRYQQNKTDRKDDRVQVNVSGNQQR